MHVSNECKLDIMNFFKKIKKTKQFTTIWLVVFSKQQNALIAAYLKMNNMA